MARRKHPHSQEPPPGANLMRPNGGAGGLPTARSKFNTPPKPVTEKESLEIRRAGARRKRWERSEEGAARITNASQALASPETGEQIPVGMLYALKGWTDTGVGPTMYDLQLPGLEDPDAAPRPPKWEELSAATQDHVHRELRKRGTSIERMTADIGAQIDQAYLRAERHGTDQPYAMDFYSQGEPRKVIDASAKELGIPQAVHAVMNSITSPNTRFSRIIGKTGEKVYPNNETAAHVVRHVLGGGTWQDITNKKIEGSGSHQGYIRNIRKAAHVMSQYLRGVPSRDWRGLPSKTNPEGSTVWGPKTGPYANSWSDSHPQFAVGDIHTGGGGAFPHLRSSKPVRLDKEGNPLLDQYGRPKREKSEREQALEDVPFAHSAIDYSLRQAMMQRNLLRIRDAQAGQWGEEQIQRGIVSEDTAYGRSNTFHTAAGTRRDDEPEPLTLF